MKILAGFWFFCAVICMLIFPLAVFANAVYTFWPSDDAWGNASNPTANYGGNTYLSVKDRSGLAEAYIRFDSQEINFLTGQTIGSAALFLYQYQGTNSPGDTVNLHCINSDWNELLVAWNARPGYDFSPVSFLSITGESNITGWREWPGLESIVLGWVEGQNFGLVLENHSDNRYNELFSRFYSSEYPEPALRPYLKVITTTTPEPASAVLFLLGSGALIIARRFHQKSS